MTPPGDPAILSPVLDLLLGQILDRFVLTRERVEGQLRSLVEGGFLPEDEARRLAGRILEELGRHRETLARAGSGAGATLSRALDLPSRADVEELKARLARLEAALARRGGARPRRPRRRHGGATPSAHPPEE
ncbi:MAG: hypothetical protein HY722_15110 [Planctomycetes bacterium]|nr:hypothetical protein [Planctomycetota bacterium]